MPKILIIESKDADFNQLDKLLWDVKKLAVKEIRRAKSKKEVQECLKKEKDFCCIILSCDLPEEGLDILKEIKTEFDSETPVLFLTANGDEILATKAIAMGAVNYFPKNKIGLVTDLFINCLQNSIELRKIDISGALKDIKIKSNAIRAKLDLALT